MKYRPEDYQESFECLVQVCHAIDDGDIELLDKLLLEPKYVECLDWSEDKYLMMCCEPDLFLDFFDLNDTSVDRYVDFMEIPLERAVKKGNIKAVEIVADAGKNLPNWAKVLANALIAAVDDNDVEIILLLLSKGADLCGSFSGDVPLVSAVCQKNIDLVKLLLSKGAFVDPASYDDLTPLMIASTHGSFEIVKTLVEAGADINYISSESGEGALLKAALHGHQEIYEYLLPLTSDLKQIECAKTMFGRYKK